MSDITVKIKFFGGFRRYGDDKVLTLTEGEGLADLRVALLACLKRDNVDFGDELLINDSAFADEEAVLAADYIFRVDAELAILPPVCGG